MKCGEFDKRNAEFEKNFTKKVFFRKLVNNNKNSPNGGDTVIFDVGAHKGESAKFFNSILPEAKIYSFEPVPFLADQIERINIKNNFVFAYALSDFNGEAKFNVQDVSHLSSLHEINHNSVSSMGYHKKEEHEQITVDVMRGDTFIENNNLPKIDLLKIDVQANEVDTLRGFSGKLKKIKSIMVEVSLYDFYQQKSSVREIEEQLTGFELYDIYEISKNPKNLGTDWATFVYKNKQFQCR